jgi:hypothetical protein
MKYFLLLLLSLPSFANDFEGYLQTHKYVKSNKAGHTDNLGEKSVYGLDFEVQHKVLLDITKLMVGFDADSTNSGFSQVAGRFGLNVELLSFDVGFYHRSNHNMDYVPKQPMRFISENYIYLRYNFGGEGR